MSNRSDTGSAPRLILHIGRHKSGTSTLQSFLSSSEVTLGTWGFFYPISGRRGIAHHGLAECYSRRNLRVADEEASALRASRLGEMNEELLAANLVPILSSEAFQNADPNVVCADLSSWSILPVAYLREPVSYLASSYVQRVHATTYSGTIEEFHRRIFRVDYAGFCHSWAAAAGTKPIVRIFDRDSLAQGDIVYDFMINVLGRQPDDIHDMYSKRDANPSLTRCLLAYKLQLNRIVADSVELGAEHEAVRTVLYRGLGQLAAQDQSGKFSLSDRFAQKVADEHNDSLERVTELFLDGQRFAAPPPAGPTAGFPSLTDEDCRDVSTKLLTHHTELECLITRSGLL